MESEGNRKPRDIQARAFEFARRIVKLHVFLCEKGRRA